MVGNSSMKEAAERRPGECDFMKAKVRCHCKVKNCQQAVLDAAEAQGK